MLGNNLAGSQQNRTEAGQWDEDDWELSLSSAAASVCAARTLDTENRLMVAESGGERQAAWDFGMSRRERLPLRTEERRGPTV